MRKKLHRYIASLFILLGILLFLKPQTKPLSIPEESSKKTIGWKTYKNDKYRFSFKYSEGQLSNFTVSGNDLGTSTLNKIKNQNGQMKDPNKYNVYFEANALKYDGKLSDFIKKNLPEAKNLTQKKIILKETEGFRISNIEKREDAYFLYNLFKKGNIIYNFALLSDDPVLIKANTPLLETTLTTVKFY